MNHFGDAVILQRLAVVGQLRPRLERELLEPAGEWVAIADRRLLTSAADAGSVVRWLRAHHQRAERVFRVPAGEHDVVGEHTLT